MQNKLNEQKNLKSQPKVYFLANTIKAHIDTKELIKPIKFTDFGQISKYKTNKRIVTISPHSFKPKLEKRYANKMISRNFFGTKEDGKG